MSASQKYFNYIYILSQSHRYSNLIIAGSIPQHMANEVKILDILDNEVFEGNVCRSATLAQYTVIIHAMMLVDLGTRHCLWYTAARSLTQ